MRTIIHYIDSLGVGGAQSMMFELYYGIKKYHPEFNQKIYLGDPSKLDSNFVSSNGITYEVADRFDIEKEINKNKNDIKHGVIIYHKLRVSETGFLNVLRIPSIVVSHTYIKHKEFNRITGGTTVVYVSQAMKDMASINCSVKDQNVIRNGVDESRYSKISQGQSTHSGFFLTGRINKLNKNKHSLDWIDWIYSLNFKKPIFHDYIGDGEYLDRTLNFVNRNKRKFKNGIKIHGLTTNFNQKVQLIKTWDIFLYEICHGEGISMAMLEALACGVPVILCSKKPSNGEVIENGINGYECENRKEAEAILKRLIDNPNELQKLKETTKKHFSEKLDIKIVADKYVNLINKIVR